MKIKTLKILSAINLVLWLIFVWMDNAWNEVLHEAVLRQEATYGEMFGPISFFRPIVLYSALILTIIISVLIFMIKLKSEKIKYRK